VAEYQAMKKKKKPRKKSLKVLRKKAWDACSIYVRQFYADSNGMVKCYTCQTVKPITEIQAGHAIGGRSNAVLFDTEIIRPQCVHCNVFMRGQYPIFTLKLIKEHSAEWFERKLNDSRQIIKMYREDYEQLIADFTLKTQQLSVEKRSQKWKLS
jgi:hypothetical protein